MALKCEWCGREITSGGVDRKGKEPGLLSLLLLHMPVYCCRKCWYEATHGN